MQRAPCSASTHRHSDRLVRRKPHQLKNKPTDIPVLYTDRDSPGTLQSLGVRRKMAERELGLYCDCVPVFTGPHEPAVENECRPWWLLSSLLPPASRSRGRFLPVTGSNF